MPVSIPLFLSFENTCIPGHRKREEYKLEFRSLNEHLVKTDTYRTLGKTGISFRRRLTAGRKGFHLRES